MQETDDYRQPDTAESGGTNKAFTGAFSDRFLTELWFATCTFGDNLQAVIFSGVSS